MQAVLFDFDGLIYDLNANWRITDSHAGIIGSYVNCLEACRIFESLRTKNEGSRITDYFSVEELRYRRHQLSSGINLLPPDSIINAARIHKQKGRELFIISSKNFDGFEAITERIYFEHLTRISHSKPLLRTNPFRNAKYIFPSSHTGSPDLSEKEGILYKTEIIKNLFEYKPSDSEDTSDSGESESIVAGSDPYPEFEFERIFVYHSQKDLTDVFNNFIKKYRELLPSGPNSLIHYYIADIM
jgi:hypothetical protein